VNLGQFIKQKRKERKLTLKQVGDAVGVSDVTVSRWERNEIKNMRIDKIQSLAAILGVSEIDFFNLMDANETMFKIERITRNDFVKEVKVLLNKTDNLSEQKRQFIFNTINLVCSDEE
jgi:transcriptional regulator with XRE-family HTH domain